MDLLPDSLLPPVPGGEPLGSARLNELTLGEQFAQAIAHKDAESVERLVDAIYDDGPARASSRDWLHQLVLHPFHHSHQRVVFTLQKLRDPASVPFLRQALAGPSDYLAYTGSESDAIAKWFSHALAAIGTPEAVQVLREFADSPDLGIRVEMRYRLKKLGH